MTRNKSPSNELMNRILRRIKKNLEDSGEVIFRYVFRTHNQQADDYANQVVAKIEGNIRQNQEEYHNSVP